ncbi:GWT1-domain-containing protein [Podospora australis]|uniref:GPI-anchored wall transfer protein n=1 Tax=Podospora australis TaxID=1536484 RepID=A0AAN7AKB3_9PEZI|nr:GWT1-domain-containing protein [Podospora australis]
MADTGASGAAAAAASQSYKQQKEAFVSNLAGGSVVEIAQVCAVAPVVTLLWSALQTRQSFFKSYTPLAFVVDFLLNVGALLLSVTLYSSAPLLLNILLLSVAAFVYVIPGSRPTRRKRPLVPPSPDAASKMSKAQAAKRSWFSPVANPTNLGLFSTKPFLTNYRGNMMVVTCICILAVDFRVFPRRFAKVETWGTSLMDMGVGSFVFSAGIVAARPLLKEFYEKTTTPLGTRLARSLRHSLPLLVLGGIRLLSVKGLDYAEHVTEYGVHWNFFFTLAFLPPFVALFQSALKVIPSSSLIALLLCLCYECALHLTSLKSFILAGPRDNLISMNREGIFSFIGYLSIFLVGQDMGMVILPRGDERFSGSRRAFDLMVALAVAAIGLNVLYFFCTNYSYGLGWTVSRRMANLPYVLWVAAFNSALLFGFMLVDCIFFGNFYNAKDKKAEKEAYETATSRILRAYNRNGLAVFLLANLLTGLVNMTVPTLDVGSVATMGILAAYLLALTAAAVGLDMYDISVKL